MGIIDQLKKFVTKTPVESVPLEVKTSDVDNLAARVTRNEKEFSEFMSYNKFIICNGKKIPIQWDKVILWSDHGGFGYDKKCYIEKTSRNPTMFVTHWDVTLNTTAMVQVTKERGLSVHFGIDNDGTIYQMLDTKEVAYHAKGVNQSSIGVEISNGVLMKYNDYYIKKGFGPRPVVDRDIIHGNNIGPHLGFYPAQIEACKQLYKAINLAHDIPLMTPASTTVVPEVVSSKYKGFVGHFHVTTNKIDPGNLPMSQMIVEILRNI